MGFANNATPLRLPQTCCALRRYPPVPKFLLPQTHDRPFFGQIVPLNGHIEIRLFVWVASRVTNPRTFPEDAKSARWPPPCQHRIHRCQPAVMVAKFCCPNFSTRGRAREYIGRFFQLKKAREMRFPAASVTRGPITYRPPLPPRHSLPPILLPVRIWRRRFNGAHRFRLVRA